MPEHVVNIDDAAGDPAVCGAYLIETIGNGEAKAQATSLLVDHLLEAGDVDKAAEFSDALEDPFSRDKLLIRIAGKCVDLKDDEYAIQLAEAIEDDGLRGMAAELVSSRFAARGDFEKATELALPLSHSSDAFAAIAVEQVAKGDSMEALATISKIEYFKSKVLARCEGAFKLIENEKHDIAREWLAAAEQEVGDVEFDEDRIRAAIEIGNGYLLLEDGEKAAEWFAKAVEYGEVLGNKYRDPILVNAAIGLMHAGDVERADEILDDVADKTDIARALHGFSLSYHADKENEDAVESIEEAYAMLKSQTEYEIRDTAGRWQMFGNVAIQFQRVGLTSRAIEIAHENADERQKNRALTQISQLLVMDGKKEEADGVIKDVAPESELVDSYIALSDAANTVENKGVAIEYVKLAADRLPEIEQYSARASIADAIALRLEAYGAKDDAIEIARANLKLAAEIKNDGNRAEGLINLAAVYKKLGIEVDETDREILYTVCRKASW